MPLRYLFGPCTRAHARGLLPAAVAEGSCLPFEHADLRRVNSWEGLCAAAGGQDPDLLVLHADYLSVPPWLWEAPAPLVALAPDAQLLWHAYRGVLPSCEAVLADAPSVERFHRIGLTQARAANLFGLDAAYLTPASGEEKERDIDILFLGNLHPAVQGARLPWLGRLARLTERWRVVVADGVHGDDYRALLRRARIVFNRSVRGECNKRTFEAVASGALLFSERGNSEVPSYLVEGKEYVSYGDDLEALLEQYLSHEDERRAVAEAGRERAAGCSFEALWRPVLEQIEGDLPELRRRARERPRLSGEEALLARLWQALGSRDGGDVTLASELHAALLRAPHRAALHNALGMALTLLGQGGGPTTDALAQQAAEHFRRALDPDPRHVLAGLNLTEALHAAGHTRLAGEFGRRTLDALELGTGPTSESLSETHFPPGYDTFRAGWERAGWDHAGDPAGEESDKKALLRWRLHALLAEQTGDSGHYHEAALARPDLPAARAALGCALARQGKFTAAVSHLRRATAANPFEPAACRALFQALTDAGDVSGARRVARDRRLLRAAAPERVPEEPWFLKAPPPGDELASLVILCCNEVNVTRLCLESVLRHTRAPYELILVDNGSKDATPEYLREVARRAGPARIEVIRNEENLGFPKGCNQGLRAARGRYLVLLNNDTVVTPGWLDRLVAWSLHEWPSVGLVGPVSNCAPAPQRVATTSNDRLDGLDAFALGHARDHAGKALAVERLTGFCLLVRREVLDRVGLLDEQFGTGFFEDDDLCLRARGRGYKLLVALDTFIHHFGSRTFQALGLDTTQQLKDNFARFQAKWGPERSRGYSLPGQPPGSLNGAAPQAPPPEVLFPPYTGKKSLCLIVRNEEHNIAECIGPVLDLFDEVIVQDTGSTDRTREVAAALGDKVKVFEGTWNDSFAEARNRALARASGDWVMWMDADDRIDADNPARLAALFAGLGNENAAYTMKCVCLPDAAGRGATVVDHVRLFRNHPRIRWEYRVHEQILPSVRRLGGAVRWADVAVTHTGYTDPALRGRKLQRDLRLLERELAERPDEPFCLFNLGCILQDLGHHERALQALRRSLERSHPADSIVRKLYALIAGCHLALGQPLESLGACKEGLQHCPDDAELLYRLGRVLTDLGNWPEAEAAFLQLLSSTPGQHFASVEAGLRGHLGRHGLAVVYHRQGRHDLALAQWRLVVQERPDFLPGWLGLGENALARNDGVTVEEAAQRLEALEGGRLEAGILRARGLLARKEVAAARALAEQVAASFPQEVGARLFLASLLLNEAHDLQAAEDVLRQALLLAPGNAEVQRALSVLLRQKVRTDTAVFVAKGDMNAWALAERYQAACTTPSDINEHLPTLHELARECQHVTGLGTQAGTATLALLAAQPKRLVCYDLVRFPQVDQLQALAGQTEFVFRQEDALRADIEETDLLFLDGSHAYEQLAAELRRHAARARRYIVLHDTTTFGERGETEGQRGLWPAVEEFLAEGSFRLKQRFTNNNGLAVLERTGATAGQEGGPT